MEYYRLKLRGLPEIAFAHEYHTDRYKFSFEKEKDFVEITFVERGTQVYNYEGYTKQVVAPSIVVDPRIEPHSGYGGQNKHFTFALMNVEVEKIQAEEVIKSINDGDIALCDVVSHKGLADEKILSQIKKLIRYHLSNKTEEQLLAKSLVLSILGALTENVRKDLLGEKDFSPMEIYYAEKMEGYILENFRNKICVKNVADEVGLSVGHASRIFKKINGNSIIDFVNAKRAMHLKELINTKNLPISSIISQYDIADEKYLYIIFKKYVGMSVKDFKNNKNL